MKAPLILFCLSLSAFAQLPPGQLDDKPLPGETETKQVGGAGFGRYSFVGSLRCKSPGDAMVGARVRKGSLIDYLQISCAPSANNSWSNSYWGPGAGNTQGGSVTTTMMCPAGFVIVGFSATATSGNTYIQDIRLRCARITGTNPLTVSPSERVYASGNGTAPAGSLIPSECAAGAASAFSVAVGKGGGPGGVVAGSNVVQALSLFCKGASSRPTGTKQLPGTVR